MPPWSYLLSSWPCLTTCLGGRTLPILVSSFLPLFQRDSRLGRVRQGAHVLADLVPRPPSARRTRPPRRFQCPCYTGRALRFRLMRQRLGGNTVSLPLAHSA